MSEQILAIDTSYIRAMNRIGSVEYVGTLIRHTNQKTNNILCVKISSTDSKIQPCTVQLNLNIPSVNPTQVTIKDMIGHVEFSDNSKMILVQVCFSATSIETWEQGGQKTQNPQYYNTVAILRSCDENNTMYDILHIETYRSNNIGRFAAMEKNTGKIYVMYGNIIHLLNPNILSLNNVSMSSQFNIEANSTVIDDVDPETTYIDIKKGLLCVKLNKSVSIFSIKFMDSSKFMLIEVSKLNIDFSSLRFFDSPIIKNRMYGISVSYDVSSGTYFIASVLAKIFIDSNNTSNNNEVRTESHMIIIDHKKTDQTNNDTQHRYLLDDVTDLSIIESNPDTKVTIDTVIDTKYNKYCIVIGNLRSNGTMLIKSFNRSQINDSLQKHNDTFWNPTQIPLTLNMVKIVDNLDGKGHNLYVYVHVGGPDGQIMRSPLEYKMNDTTCVYESTNKSTNETVNRTVIKTSDSTSKTFKDTIRNQHFMGVVGEIIDWIKNVQISNKWISRVIITLGIMLVFCTVAFVIIHFKDSLISLNTMIQEYVEEIVFSISAYISNMITKHPDTEYLDSGDVMTVQISGVNENVNSCYHLFPTESTESLAQTQNYTDNHDQVRDHIEIIIGDSVPKCKPSMLHHRTVVLDTVENIDIMVNHNDIISQNAEPKIDTVDSENLILRILKNAHELANTIKESIINNDGYD